jgi:hypothetical protein
MTSFHFRQSVQGMIKTLKRDIYQLRHPGYSIDQVRPPNPDPLVAIRYSCIYWVDHLDSYSHSQNSTEEFQDSSALDTFLRQNMSTGLSH